ncbi:MAG: sensor histidine kinase [Bacillota bacterium]
MRYLKNKINSLNFKQKMIFYGYALIVPVLIGVCIALTFNNYYTIKDDRTIKNNSQVKILSENINFLQNEVKQISVYICINREIYNLITSFEPDVKNTNSLVWATETPIEFLEDTLSFNENIKSIAIYPLNGIMPYLRGMDGSVYLQAIEEVQQQSIYFETLQSKNSMMWKMSEQNTRGDSQDIYAINRSDKIVFYRAMYDLRKQNVVAFISLGVDKKNFILTCENILEDEADGVIIFDANGNELIQVGAVDQEVDQVLQGEEFLNQIKVGKVQSMVHGNYEIIYEQMENNSFIVCKIVPIYNFSNQFFDIVSAPLVLLFSIFLVVTLLFQIISNLVTRPLETLGIAIKKFSKGDFTQQVPVESQDELGEIAECFNRMVGDIERLVEENYVAKLREKESELSALQANLNPHFLYNTLDCLYWQSLSSGNNEVADSILSLSKLFRLVLSQGRNEITIHEEVELVTMYLQIQKMRFKDTLQYSIHIDDDIREFTITKLILQPFVENAIVHGFQNQSGNDELTVIGCKCDQYIRFKIKDTGCGMNEEQVAKLLSQNDTKEPTQGYAIRNIYERLRLKYHSDFKLEIESQIGVGTTIYLSIPYKEGDDQCL